MKNSKLSYSNSSTSLKQQPSRGSTATQSEQLATLKVESAATQPSLMDEAYNAFIITQRIDSLLGMLTQRLTGNGHIDPDGQPHPDFVSGYLAQANNNLWGVESRLNWLLAQVGDNGPDVVGRG